MIKRRILYLLLLLYLAVSLNSQSIVGTKHDMSAGGNRGNFICEYCHTPHSAVPATPLWGRNIPGTSYTMYDQATSSTSDIPINPSRQPDGSSILCLTCHDGTIAPGNPERTIPAGSSAIFGTDLTDDHPISFVYDNALAASDGQLKTTPLFPATLDANSKVQCSSCHDPHDDSNSSFLLATNEFSDLCFKCHDRDYWGTSTHSTSNASWNGTGTDPWAHIANPYPTVAQNGCSSCHGMHSAGGHERLMKAFLEEMNCLDCHNGNVASSGKNISSQITKAYRHDVSAYNEVHEPNEPSLLPITNKHVECSDCHNPHAVNNSSANPPNASGFLSGVSGLDQNGLSVDPVQYEYELCFRCHSDNPVTSSVITRQVEQSNTRMEFSPNAVSFHPVEIQGRNSNVPTLIPTWSESSLLYCTDCHASNGIGAPAGPHGSIYPQILKFQYETTDNTNESAQAYELCYTCHSRNQFTNDTGDNVQKDVHFKHVTDENTPCSVCHDPHGISNSQGNLSNNSHLINFDLSIVNPSKKGRLYFQDDGERSGRCYLNCHGKNHSPKSY